MIILSHRLRTALASLALVLVAAIAVPSTASAQQQPNSVNPTAQSVKEQQLLDALKPGDAVSGRISIPDPRAATLIQPAGQTWRSLNQGILQWVGGLSVLGMSGLLLLFYAKKGRIRTSKGPSGQTITRFNGFERFTHWLTASCFLVLAISGLNVTFGKFVLLPLLGPEAFTAWSIVAKWSHNYLAFPFMLGVVLMLLVWIKDNIPSSTDVAWFKAGGGILGSGHPPAARFNGGQKLVFWTVIVAGAVMSVTGLILLFPFVWTGQDGMQLSNVIHGALGAVFVAVMIAHIYIGSIGMEGAFDAMGSGEVDVNWAKEHHSIWAEEALRARSGVNGAMKPMAAE